MSDNRSVSGHIEVTQDGRTASALKLMEHIGRQEFTANAEQQKTRAYWLTLYRQCYKAANGNNLESILKQE